LKATEKGVELNSNDTRNACNDVDMDLEGLSSPGISPKGCCNG